MSHMATISTSGISAQFGRWCPLQILPVPMNPSFSLRNTLLLDLSAAPVSPNPARARECVMFETADDADWDPFAIPIGVQMFSWLAATL